MSLSDLNGGGEMNDLSAISERVVGSAVSAALADLGRMNSSAATPEREREEEEADPRDVSPSAPPESNHVLAESDALPRIFALPILQNSIR